MMEDRMDDIHQLSMEENVLLTANFSEEKVYKAISQMGIINLLGQMDFQQSSSKSFGM
jgi:hypothetical protein